MLVGAPHVETEQYRSIRVEDLPEVVVGRSRLQQAKQRLVPLEALRHVSHANDRPRALPRALKLSKTLCLQHRRDMRSLPPWSFRLDVCGAALTQGHPDHLV